MKIEVLYFAEFKDITGKEKEVCDIKDNLKDLLDLLFNKYNPVKKLLWDETSNYFKNSIRLAINDEITNQEDLLNIPLSDGDRVAFLLPLSGG